jgi:ABC-2 type transport system ATP-binding protein
MGVALQDIGLDPLMTAREMLELQAMLYGKSRQEAKSRTEELLYTVGLHEVPRRKRTGTYSGGMKRRLDLALALVHDPSILFLDEPTTGLDPSSRAAIWDEVRKLNKEKGMTIFLTTQYLEEADRLADKIAIIHDGLIIASGSPEELKKDIGEEAVAIDFKDSDQAASGYSALSERMKKMIAGSRVYCYTKDAAEAIPEIVRLLDQRGIPMKGLHVNKPSLDDVFLKLTGEPLKTGGIEAA